MPWSESPVVHPYPHYPHCYMAPELLYKNQIVFVNCLDACDTSPDSGERQYKSKAWNRRFDLTSKPMKFITLVSIKNSSRLLKYY